MTLRFFKYWLPVLIWMFLIFSASSDTMSGQRSSRIIAPVVRWLFPSISDKALEDVVHCVRKTAHVTEYAILALLLWRALRGQIGVSTHWAIQQSNNARMGPWRWPVAGLAFALAVLYAITDEFHQAFVPSRQAQVLDVVIDSLGAALGLLALWLFGRFFRKYW